MEILKRRLGMAWFFFMMKAPWRGLGWDCGTVQDWKSHALGMRTPKKTWEASPSKYRCTLNIDQMTNKLSSNQLMMTIPHKDCLQNELRTSVDCGIPPPPPPNKKKLSRNLHHSAQKVHLFQAWPLGATSAFNMNWCSLPDNYLRMGLWCNRFGEKTSECRCSLVSFATKKKRLNSGFFLWLNLIITFSHYSSIKFRSACSNVQNQHIQNS